MTRDAELRPVPSPRPSGRAIARALALAGRAIRAAGRRLTGGVSAPSGLAAALSLGVLAAAAVAPAEPAAAQSATPPATPVQGAACGSRAEVVSRLRAKYGETRRGYGLQRGKAVVEVYASAKTGSWTIIMSMPDGLACLVAAGENWAAPSSEAAEAVGDPA